MRLSAVSHTISCWLFCAAGSFIGSVQSLDAERRWYTAEAEGIEFVGNCAKWEIQKVHDDLVDVRDAFRRAFPMLVRYDQRPLRLILANDTQTIRQMQLAGGPKPSDAHPGYFDFQFYEDTIILEVSADKEFRQRFLKFLYANRLVLQIPNLPQWAATGLRDLFSSVETSSQDILIGRRNGFSCFELVEIGFMPLPEMFDFDDTSFSADGLTDRWKTQYLAQSQLMVHFCLFSPGHPYRQALLDFLSDRRARLKGEAGFEEHFGVGYDSFEEEFHEYVRQGSLGIGQYETLTAQRPERLESDALVFREMDQNEVRLCNALVLANHDRFDEASALLEATTDSFDDSAAFHRTSAVLAFRMKDYAAAESSMRRAVERGATGGRQKFVQALSAVHNMLPEGDHQTDQEVASLGHEELVYLLELLYDAYPEMAWEPLFYRILSKVWLHAEALDPSHLNVLVKGWNLFPQDEELTENVAGILERMDRREDAARIRADSQKLNP